MITPLSLQNGWRQAAGVDTAGVVADGAFAVLTGALLGGTIKTVIATLPAWAAPLHDEWFSVVTADNICAPLVIHANGQIILNGGHSGFLSLAGIRVLVNPNPTPV